jgi:hypothetical protein
MKWTAGMTGILRPLNELEIDFEGARLRDYAKFSAPGTSEQVIVHLKALKYFDGKTRVRVIRVDRSTLIVEFPDRWDSRIFPHFLMVAASTKPIDGIRKIRI